LGLGAVAAAAVAGAAVHRAPKKKRAVADYLAARMLEQELHAAAAVEKKLSTLALMGEPQTLQQRE
jgi:hypothetical protein